MEQSPTAYITGRAIATAGVAVESMRSPRLATRTDPPDGTRVTSGVIMTGRAPDSHAAATTIPPRVPELSSCQGGGAHHNLLLLGAATCCCSVPPASARASSPAPSPM